MSEIYSALGGIQNRIETLSQRITHLESELKISRSRAAEWEAIESTLKSEFWKISVGHKDNLGKAWAELQPQIYEILVHALELINRK